MALQLQENLIIYVNTIKNKKLENKFRIFINKSSFRCPICDQGGECDYKI